MTDTLTQRVAWAIEAEALLMANEQFSPDAARPKTERFAQAAIEASGAQHLQGLVEALKKYGQHDSYCGIGMGKCTCGFDETLAALTPELRGER
jgi:hypothetical protein